MRQTFLLHSPEDTHALAAELSSHWLPGTLTTLSGELGAGKTTFAQGVLKAFGAEKPYTSPTFVIMKQYDLPRASAHGIQRIYHVDAYRVDAVDLKRLGWEEWLSDETGLILMEWPERITSLLPEKKITIVLESVDEKSRKVVYTGE